MRLMYSEKEDAERILRNGFKDGFRRKDVLCLAKYYRHVNGWKDARIKRNILNFCRDNVVGFRNVPRMEMIRQIVRDSKQPFVETSKVVVITEEEYRRIRSIKNYKYQTILLALLVIAKINDRDSAKLSEWKYIRKIISRYITNKDIKSCITFCYNSGYIGEIRRNDLHSILFINNSGKPVIQIKSNDDLFGLGEVYEKLCGGKLGFCKICKNEFIRESNRHSYCSNCSITLEKKRKHVKKAV